MTCICKTTKTIPKEEAIEFFAPIKGTNLYQLVERFHKKCDIHGIKYLTQENASDITEPQSMEVTDGNENNHTSPSNAEDTLST
jgi:hypothetical protein